MRAHYTSTPIVNQVLSVLLIFLFGYTASSKLLNQHLFYEQLRTFPAIHFFAGAIAWILPLAEILTAVMLLVPSRRLFGFYSALTLLSVFTIYLLLTISFSDRIPCSCGGVIQMMTWKQHILFNILFIILSLIGVATEKRLHIPMIQKRKQSDI